VPEEDQVVLVVEDDQVMPADDRDESAGLDDRAVPTDGKVEPDLAAVDPDGAVMAAESGSAALADDHRPADPAATGPMPVTGISGTPDAAGRADDAGVTGAPARQAGPVPVNEPGAAPGGASSGGRWHEIQAMFVDDPRASVELAAGLVNDSVEAFVTSVKNRQSSLQSAWEGNDADTEQLRTALQQYRIFSRRLDDFSLQS
jgi:hypothetical protein